jgi:hypothetical protein
MGLHRQRDRVRTSLFQDRPGAASPARVKRQSLKTAAKTAALLSALFLLSVGVWVGIGLAVATWLR